MPLGQSQDIPQADPEGRVTPRFWHRLIRFRHFIDGSLALASLNLACRNLVPAFPQRSPPLDLTTAACGGLRSVPDCRPRRALLHLSYSCAPPFGPAILVTHGPERISFAGFSNADDRGSARCTKPLSGPRNYSFRRRRLADCRPCMVLERWPLWSRHSGIALQDDLVSGFLRSPDRGSVHESRPLVVAVRKIPAGAFDYFGGDGRRR